MANAHVVGECTRSLRVALMKPLKDRGFGMSEKDRFRFEWRNEQCRCQSVQTGRLFWLPAVLPACQWLGFALLGRSTTMTILDLSELDVTRENQFCP